MTCFAPMLYQHVLFQLRNGKSTSVIQWTPVRCNSNELTYICFTIRWPVKHSNFILILFCAFQKWQISYRNIWPTLTEILTGLKVWSSKYYVSLSWLPHLYTQPCVPPPLLFLLELTNLKYFVLLWSASCITWFWTHLCNEHNPWRYRPNWAVEM